MLNKRNIAAGYARIYNFLYSWKTTRKIVVIESDDWGSIRSADCDSIMELEAKGYDFSKSAYSYDSLETNQDLEELFSVLSSVRDKFSRPASFTANMVMANPDFHAIKASNFNTYKRISTHVMVESDSSRNRIVELWKKGLNSKLFIPQLHALEHVRYWDWIRDLYHGEREARLTFEHKMCGVPKAVSKNSTSYFLPIHLRRENLNDLGVNLSELIRVGSELFVDVFGFTSSTTIAPNCAWTDDSEYEWKQLGINIVQGGYLQEIHGNASTTYKAHYLGQRNSLGQMYFVRNCSFEPAYTNNTEHWLSTLAQVKRAFKRNTPAIISSHRVNYIGSIKQDNRENGLRQLELLLHAIVQEYPDVEFISSNELAGIMLKEFRS